MTMKSISRRALVGLVAGLVTVTTIGLAQAETTHGRQISLEESLENLNAVTLDDIQSLAREYFRTEDVAFAALGDLTELKIERERLKIN